MKLPRLRFNKQLGQDGSIALAVNEAWPDDRHGQSMAAMVVKHQGLGLGFGSGVSIERIGGGGHGLIGSVMVAPLVHAERADVDEPLEPGRYGRIEQQAECFHVEPAELVEGSPVTDLGRAVENPVGPGDTGLQRLGVFQVADDRLDAPLVEPARVARGTDERPDPMASLECLFGRMAADQTGRAGDENRFRCRRVHGAPRGSGNTAGRGPTVILLDQTKPR